MTVLLYSFVPPRFYPCAYSEGVIENSIGFDMADFINGLRALISFPQMKTPIGAAAKTNEMKPSSELAQ